jgi:hypothetical protein
MPLPCFQICTSDLSQGWHYLLLSAVDSLCFVREPMGNDELSCSPICSFCSVSEPLGTDDLFCSFLRVSCLPYSLALGMKTVCSFEMLTDFQQSTALHYHCHNNLISDGKERIQQ